MKRTTILSLCCFALLTVSAGCAPLMQSFNGHSRQEDAAARARARRARLAAQCDVEDGKDPLLVVPYGRYKGTGDHGDVKLDLHKDHTFSLLWHSYSGAQGQWAGHYKWDKSGIGEVLKMCSVRRMVAGRVQNGTQTLVKAVTGVQKDRHKFTIQVSPVGNVAFAPR